MQVLAPPNTLGSGDNLLVTSPEAPGLIEPADNMIFLALVGIGALTVLAGWLSHRNSRSVLLLDCVPSRFATVLALAALGFSTLTIFFPLAEGFQVNRSPVSVLPISIFVGTVVLTRALNGLIKQDEFSVWIYIFGIAICIFVAQRLYQNPSSLFDPYHYQFVANELGSVASGNFPLGGYVSQYSNLIPYVVAPAILLLPFDALMSVVFVSLIMQLLTALFAAKLLWHATERMETRMIGLVLVATYAVLVRSYQQFFPLRLLLPVLAFSTMLTLFKESRSPRSVAVMYSVLGAWLPVLALNNPDHGLPAGLALMVAFFIPTSVGTARSWTLVGATTLGILVSFCTVAGGIRLISGSFTLSDAFAFTRAFGVSGYMREPMALFEPTAVVFPLGLIALGLGFSDDHRRKGSAASRRLLLLRLVGIFQILSLAYPLGRSFSTTFEVALLPSVILVVLISDHVLMSSRNDSLINPNEGPKVRHWVLAFTGVAFLFVVGRVVTGFQTGVYSEDGKSAALAYLEESTFFDLPPSIIDGAGGQVLEWSAIVELDFGVESLLVANHPGSVALVSEVAERQCDVLASTAGRVIMTVDTARHLQGVATCRRLWLERGLEVPRDSELVVLGELVVP